MLNKLKICAFLHVEVRNRTVFENAQKYSGLNNSRLTFGTVFVV